MKFTVYIGIGEKPNDVVYTAKCDLPNEDPELAYCETEYFRDSSRSEFSRNLYDSLANNANSADMLKAMNYSIGKNPTSIYLHRRS